MSNKEADGVVAAIGCMGMIPAIIVAYFLKGWAIVTLWGWFISPTWHLQIPSMAAAVGLSILVSAITGIHHTAKKDDESVLSTMLTAYGYMLLPPIMSVCVGWCVKSWM